MALKKLQINNYDLWGPHIPFFKIVICCSSAQYSDMTIGQWPLLILHLPFTDKLVLLNVNPLGRKFSSDLNPF